MRSIPLIAGFVLALGLGFGLTIDAPQPGSGAGVTAVGFTLPTAEALPARRVARRTARRTSRRTTARMNYYSSLPAGCPLRGAYYYCGGVYYQPVVRGGSTTYVIVNP